MAIFFVVFLAALITDQGVSLSLPDNQNCSYTFIVETTCASNAGTSDHVSLRFGDAAGTDVLIRHLHKSYIRRVDATHASDVDDVPHIPFRPCGIDQFRVTGTCMKSPVCYLYLKQTGHDRWRPSLVQVVVDKIHLLSSQSVHIRRFLPQNVWHGFDMCDTKVTPFGVKFNRKVFPHL